MSVPATKWERVRGAAIGWWARVCMRLYAWQLLRAEGQRRRAKAIWRCYRDHGGGVLTVPKPMTELAALKWLRTAADAEVYYVDREHYFLFYRPRSHD